MVSRRSFLKSLGVGGLLPFIPLLEARGQTAAPPKRLIVFYTSNGTVHEKWLPTMSNGQLVLSPILQPLAAHAGDLLVVAGLGYNVVPPGLADGHYGGMNAALTGAAPQIVDPTNGLTLSTGISIDQSIANAIGASRPFRSLQCGVQVERLAPTLDTISFSGSLQPVPPDNNPYNIFNRVFSTTSGPDPSAVAAQQLRLDRSSVLDFVKGDLARVIKALGTADRAKLEAHLQHVRELEAALAATPMSTCVPPTLGAQIDVNANQNIPALSKLQMDLLVAAMACDLTRVGSIQHGRAGASHRHTWLGPEFSVDSSGDGVTGIHSLAHDNGNPVSRDKLTRCNIWYAGQVNYLVNKLKSIPEGNGTLADNTLVVWMNEFGNGGNHSKANTPWVLIGSLGGYFRTGRVVSFPGQPHNDLLTSIGQAFGLPLTGFGAPAFSKGPLPGLT
jgi:hypothetical protein